MTFSYSYRWIGTVTPLARRTRNSNPGRPGEARDSSSTSREVDPPPGRLGIIDTGESEVLHGDVELVEAVLSPALLGAAGTGGEGGRRDVSQGLGLAEADCCSDQFVSV